MSSVTQAGPIHLGLDVHKDSISVAVLPWGQDTAEVDKIFHDEPSVRRLVARFPDSGRLRACYEAGPTGYELQRLLARLRVRCDVVAPALIPKAPGDRVKTDRRDARRLARLHRAGELVAIRVPSPVEEAVRDLCRARADVVDDRRRARQRLGKFGLRHGRVYRGGAAWTVGHERWLAAQSFAEPALVATYARYRAAVSARDAELAAIEADLALGYDRDPFAEQVARLAAYRGIDRLGALTLASEVCDWRRFPRATAFMGFTGLVPSEYSSGESTRRGHVTKAGNAHLRTQLIESAWAYRNKPLVGIGLRTRQEGVPAQTLARSWTAQQRLCGRFAPDGRAQERQDRGRHRRRPRAGRLPVGGDDRLASMTTAPASGPPVGAVRRAPRPTTRRRAAGTATIPVSTMRRTSRRAPSPGHPAAHPRCAVPTREYLKWR